MIVAIHDVAPPHRRSVSMIIEQLAPLVGDRLSAAVIPKYHGLDWRWDPSFTDDLASSCGEITLHGYTHRIEGRVRWREKPLSWLTKKANEFGADNSHNPVERMKTGRMILGDLFGSAPRGFVPPAWRLPGGAEVAYRAGFDFSVGYFRLWRRARLPIRLATISWDCGRWRGLGWLGEGLGLACSLASSTPCIVFHPADVARGFLPRGTDLVKSLLDAGERPGLFGDWLEG